MVKRTKANSLRLLVVLALPALLAACAPQGEAEPTIDATTPPPEGPPAGMPGTGVTTVMVSMVEYEILIAMEESIPAGPTAFEVTNDGTMAHNFRVQGEGTDVSLASDLQPGETAVLEIALEPGVYEVTCPILNHAQLGMRTEITVVSGS